MKFDYDSIPTLMLFAAGLFVMFASPPVVQYDSVESAGKFMPFNGDENKANGAAFVLESDDYMDKALAIADAYTSLDEEKLLSLMTEDMKSFADNMDDLETYSWRPWAMVPLRRVGDDGAFVVSWSYDTSEQKNGSKAATNYIDVLRFNDADNGKLSAISSTLRKDVENSEYGLPEGGKIYTDNDYDGRPLVFSNRGEVEIMESVVEAYNNKDVEGFLEHFADEWQATDHEGNTETRTKADAKIRMQQWFDNSETIEWKPWSIYALKIKDTDPGSGITVRSTEKRVGKDGSVWEKRLVEWFYFDPSGKITRFSQFAQDIQAEE